MCPMITADNQPIQARPGSDAVWLTDFITPNNPSVRLKHDEITAGITSLEDRIIAQWQYVAKLPYREIIGSSLRAGGKSFSQPDTWFFPSEVISMKIPANCANRAFLLASLLKNDLPSPGQVYCVFGQLSLDGIGNHAWVETQLNGRQHIIETTVSDLDKAIFPTSNLDIYGAKVYFDEDRVYVVDGADAAETINARFGVCAVPFLKEYLCEKCLELEV